MNIQIYGKSKSFDTKKAEMFFKERKIKYQMVDLAKYGLSKREFESVVSALGVDALIDTKSREYEALFIKYITPEAIVEKLFENPGLYAAPIVRNGRLATVGYKPEVWKAWE